MLYKLAAVSAVLAVSLAQEEEIETTSIAAIESTDSLDLLDSTESGIEASSFGDSMESTSTNDFEDDTLEFASSSSLGSASDEGDDVGDDDDDDEESLPVGDDDDDDDDFASKEGNEDDVDGDDAGDDEDVCVGLEQDECLEQASADGDQECGFNAVNNECYSVERRAGSLGSGNYDDGFKAARDASAAEATQLYTVVGVLGGIIGALLLVMGGGFYYMHSKSKNYDMSYDVEQEMNQISQANTANNDDDGEELIQKSSMDNVQLDSVVEVQ